MQNKGKSFIFDGEQFAEILRFKDEYGRVRCHEIWLHVPSSNCYKWDGEYIEEVPNGKTCSSK